MREILFKAKYKYDGEWKVGGIVHQTDFYGDKVDKYFIIDGTETEDNDIGYNYEVIPETVGQYTGLKDIHGVKVFEGDIVYYDGSCHKVVFENRNGAGYFGIVIGENETWGFGNSTPAYMMAVVGNIYDNPDLLEVSKE